MNIVSDFKFKLNKEKIINSVQSYCQTPPYEELSNIYDDLLPLLKEYSKPIGLFKIEEKQIQLELLNNCRYVIYCAVTIGQNSTEKADKFFKEGKFLEAVLFDAMSSFYLFDISSQLFRRICEKFHNVNLGLTSKIAPGDGELELEYQKEIVSKLVNEELHDISIVHNCMLYPSKSMSYIYGADESISFNQYNDHCCETCYNTFCKMRNAPMTTGTAFFAKTGCA
jgi:hypothetical protein